MQANFNAITIVVAKDVNKETTNYIHIESAAECVKYAFEKNTYT